ncbi:hypothetical protein [Yersinia artesiana]|uniref:hypothetical protein n=1 Tax=Yersinia artesiana TaxID=2890315 RepID=UPI0015814369|nr:hypothetical protein [Yersinia artesiana]
MESVTKSEGNDNFNGNIDNALAILLSNSTIKLRHIERDSILLSIEGADFIKFLDIFFMLSQDENIEVSYVDIKYTKNSDYIHCEIALRKKSEKGI